VGYIFNPVASFRFFDPASAQRHIAYSKQSNIDLVNDMSTPTDQITKPEQVREILRRQAARKAKDEEFEGLFKEAFEESRRRVLMETACCGTIIDVAIRLDEKSVQESDHTYII
jgi:hypothetical protein